MQFRGVIVLDAILEASERVRASPVVLIEILPHVEHDVELARLSHVQVGTADNQEQVVKLPLFVQHDQRLVAFTKQNLNKTGTESPIKLYFPTHKIYHRIFHKD